MVNAFHPVAPGMAVLPRRSVLDAIACLPIAVKAIPILAVLLELAPASLAQDTPPHLPNIVVIYADDLGYGDVQCYNPERGKIPTPHIDKLASQGMRFMDAHSSSGVCSPSRPLQIQRAFAKLAGRAPPPQSQEVTQHFQGVE